MAKAGKQDRVKTVTSYVLAGLIIGAFLGFSTGVALGGFALNGALVFGPLGAFIGWVFASSGRPSFAGSGPKPAVVAAPLADAVVDLVAAENASSLRNAGAPSSARGIIHAVLTLLALAWNSHIELLRVTHLLPIFLRKTWLFLVLCVVASFIFPPFFAIYFACYLGAAQFGISKETEFRAMIN
jgi:hypothetical protein